MNNQQKIPKGWHEFVPGNRDLNGNIRCAICGYFKSMTDHQRCIDCGSYDIYAICGASCGEGRCEEHFKTHWCKSMEESLKDRGGR